MRIIQFEYKGTTRVALEIEADDRKINCMHCLQATKDGEIEVGFRSFKVPDMRDVQTVADPQAIMEANPEFLAGVQGELHHEGKQSGATP